jgi:hypothetical protein
MSTGEAEKQPSEQELRAAYEAQLKKIRIEHVLLEHVVSLVNLGMRRTGLVKGTEEERDPGQVRLAIEAVRAVMPLLEQAAPNEVAKIRDALTQLQLAYVKIGGQPARAASGQPGDAGAGEPQQPPPVRPGEPGPAQRSGRLWVPGQ